MTNVDSLKLAVLRYFTTSLESFQKRGGDIPDDLAMDYKSLYTKYKELIPEDEKSRFKKLFDKVVPVGDSLRPTLVKYRVKLKDGLTTDDISSLLSEVAGVSGSDLAEMLNEVASDPDSLIKI